jgi:hypothetical protein
MRKAKAVLPYVEEKIVGSPEASSCLIKDASLAKELHTYNHVAIIRRPSSHRSKVKPRKRCSTSYTPSGERLWKWLIRPGASMAPRSA